MNEEARRPAFAGPPTLGGLILGYGAATLTQVRRAATVLGPLLAGLPLRENSRYARTAVTREQPYAEPAVTRG